MATLAPPVPLADVTAEFARELAQVARVVAVATSAAFDGLTVWTLLEGDADGEARRAVYDLELALADRHPDTKLLFHVLDASDYPDSPRSAILPPGAHVIYGRPGVDLSAPASPPGDGR